MIGRPRYIQILILLVAVGLLVAAGFLQGTIQRSSMFGATNIAALQRTPELAVLTTVPGGLRVLFVNYLWIRSQTAHQEGVHA